jgi:adenylyltransferase/sulfurtransferase
MQQYKRQLILPELGAEGQTKLQQASVLVIGAGGLGCPVLLYLAAAGVGKIGIMDFDTISIDNLHRQVLYNHQDLGKPKATVAAQKLAALNPHIRIEPILQKLDNSNALSLFQDYEVIIDGSDNFPTRYLINDAAVLCDKPLIYGAIYKYEGQVSVFNTIQMDGTRSANYRDLFPTPPEQGSVPSCSEIGVIGVLPGIIGSLQANEAIKLITGMGEPLIEKLYTIDTLTLQSFTIKYKSQESTNITELINYDSFCQAASDPRLKIISPLDLEKLINSEQDLQLIDVRQSIEHDHGHLADIHIPLEKLKTSVTPFDYDKKIVLYCRTGKRSEKALKIMLDLGFSDIAHLQGGLLAYVKQTNSRIKVL